MFQIMSNRRVFEKSLMRENFADLKFFSISLAPETTLDLGPGARINLRSAVVARPCTLPSIDHVAHVTITSVAGGMHHLLTVDPRRANTQLVFTLNSLDAFGEDRHFRVSFRSECACVVHLTGDFIGHFIKH